MKGKWKISFSNMDAMLLGDFDKSVLAESQGELKKEYIEETF